MTIKIINYSSREEFLRRAKIENSNGWHALNYNFPHKVTWVNGTDDPNKTPPLRNLTQTQFLRELAKNNDVKIV